MKAIPSGLVGRRRGMGLSSHTVGRGGQLPGSSGVAGAGSGEGPPRRKFVSCGVPSPARSAFADGRGRGCGRGRGRRGLFDWSWRRGRRAGGAPRRLGRRLRGRCGGGAGVGAGVGWGAGVGVGAGVAGFGFGVAVGVDGFGVTGGWARRGWRGRPSWGGSDDADGLWEGASSGRRHRRLRLRLRGRALRRLTCRRGRNADHGALLLRRDRIERMSEARGGVRVAA